MIGQAITFFSCGFYLSSFFLFFLANSQRSEIGCLPYFYTWCGLCANLECRSEMCCTRLAGNAGRKNRHLHTIAQLCRAVSSQIRHVSTIGKKFVKQQYVPHMSARLCGVVQGMELRNFRRGRLSSWVSAHILDIFAVFSSGT